MTMDVQVISVTVVGMVGEQNLQPVQAQHGLFADEAETGLIINEKAEKPAKADKKAKADKAAPAKADKKAKAEKPAKAGKADKKAKAGKFEFE